MAETQKGAPPKKVVRQLRVALSPSAAAIPAVRSEIIDKGHEVTILPELDQYDVVLGPRAHRLDKTDWMQKLVPVIVKRCRVEVYGPKGSRRLRD